MDGEMGCNEGRKDCKLEVSVLGAGAGRWETLVEPSWYICRHTNKHKCGHRGIHTVCTYIQWTEYRRIHNEKKLAACVNNVCINHSMRGANQLWLLHGFMSFPSLQIQSRPAISISNKAPIHMTNDFWMLLTLYVTTALHVPVQVQVTKQGWVTVPLSPLARV